MLSPGANFWIDKYENLINQGKINLHFSQPKEVPLDEYLHFSLANTGVFFGIPTQLLFSKNVGETKWTESEKLKVLLFESLLLVFLTQTSDKENSFPQFIEKLKVFYTQREKKKKKNWITRIFSSPEELMLESVLSERIQIKPKKDYNILQSYFNNSFVFLDVILFRLYIENEKMGVWNIRKKLAQSAMQVIIYAIHSDGIVKKKGKEIFQMFLLSSNLSKKDKKQLSASFETGIAIKSIYLGGYLKGLFKRYLLDLAVLSFRIEAYGDKENEVVFDAQELTTYLGLNADIENECVALVETFILQNYKSIPILNSNTSYERAFGSFSKHWVKVLDRNKDKLGNELKQSKELVFLIKKSATTELTADEKEMVKSQFLDIIKSMPALAIFMLPGGALLLPIVLKIIPDLIPSAFRDNEIEK